MTTFSVVDGYFRYGIGRPFIVNSVSLSVRSGELLAILGPNGAGKTTLLRTMIGLQSWTKGQSFLDGVALNLIPAHERGRRISYVPQARNAASLSVSGVDMVVLGRAAHLGTYSQPGDAERQMAYETLASIGARELADMPCGSMSGGQYQMVLIARALIAEPEVLVLDEPETGLDFHNQLIVLSVLEDLVRNRGLAVVMNTHYPAHAVRLADQVVLLNAKREAVSGRVDEVITRENLSGAFVADVHIGSVECDDLRVPTVTPLRLLSNMRMS